MQLETLLALAQEAGYQKRCWEEYDERSQAVNRHPAYERDAECERRDYEEMMDKLNEAEAAFHAETALWMPTSREGAPPSGLNPFDSLEAVMEHLGSLRGALTAKDINYHRDAAEEASGRLFQELCLLLPELYAAYEGTEAR